MKDGHSKRKIRFWHRYDANGYDCRDNLLLFFGFIRLLKNMKRIGKIVIRSAMSTILNKIKAICSSKHNGQAIRGIIGIWRYRETVGFYPYEYSFPPRPMIYGYDFTFYENGSAEMVFTDSDGEYMRGTFHYYIKRNTLYIKFEDDQKAERYSLLHSGDTLAIKFSKYRWMNLQRIKSR